MNKNNSLDGAEGVDELIAILQTLRPEDWSNRTTIIQAINKLAELGDKRATQSLVNSLQAKKDYIIRAAAASALGKLGDAQAIDPLIQALDDEIEDVYVNAATSLAEFNEPRVVAALIAVLINKDDDNWVDGQGIYVLSHAAKKSLVKLGVENTFEPLVVALKNEHEDIRFGAIDVLGRLGDERAVPVLLEFFQDQSKSLRFAAIGAFGKLKDKRGLQPLLAVLVDKNEFLSNRVWAVTSLAELADQRAFDVMLKVYQDKNEEEYLRGYAIKFLPRVDAPQAQPVCAQALNDESEFIKISARQALAELEKTPGT